ncbi:hypothetical protein CRYUN_Cryun19dG0045300 [Craigia yunnanensis]
MILWNNKIRKVSNCLGKEVLCASGTLKWGDISSEDEAITLETQVTLLFSQIPEGPSYRLSHRSHEQSGPGQEVEVVMAAKVTSLPPEPAIDDENAEKCSEDFDFLGLCCHIDEEHHLEAGYGVLKYCYLSKSL